MPGRASGTAKPLKVRSHRECAMSVSPSAAAGRCAHSHSRCFVAAAPAAACAGAYDAAGWRGQVLRASAASTRLPPPPPPPHVSLRLVRAQAPKAGEKVVLDEDKAFAEKRRTEEKALREAAAKLAGGKKK